MNGRSPYFFVALICSLCVILSRCADREPHGEPGQAMVFWNHADSVGYVGISTCRSCHADIYSSFMQTGMGQSINVASRTKSALPDSIGVLVDSMGGFHYRPYFIGDSLYLEEKLHAYAHERQEQVGHIIGSGQHTNSHLFETNGFYHQMPFTFYTQDGRLDLPPGFENGQNSRFSRPIGLECMSCHNAMPTGFVMGSENRFTDIPNGIDCERCHGPGEAHVNKILNGDITDTAATYDPSIVNPARLSMNLQMEICQRCHLQGNVVLKPGKSFFDFRPGMELSEVMEVFMPRPQADPSDEGFIMAGHIQRFKLSKCFEAADGQFGCTSCHNPHKPVHQIDHSTFNSTCSNCHTERSCSLPEEDRMLSKNDCVHCHMPKTGSSDIPHVKVHDHYIAVHDGEDRLDPSVENGLYAVNNERPSRLSRLKAYVQQFERFEGRKVLLDSASRYLDVEGFEGMMARVHYHYLREEWEAIRSIALSLQPDQWEQLKVMRYDNATAWTNYRMAVALRKGALDVEADRFFRNALLAAPSIPEFYTAYASFLLERGEVEAALEQYAIAHELHPMETEALNGLGYISLQRGELTLSENYLNDCIALDPDHILARINRVLLHLQAGNKDLMEMDLRFLKDRHSEDPRVQRLLDYLKELI